MFPVLHFLFFLAISINHQTKNQLTDYLIWGDVRRVVYSKVNWCANRGYCLLYYFNCHCSMDWALFHRFCQCLAWLGTWSFAYAVCLDSLCHRRFHRLDAFGTDTQNGEWTGWVNASSTRFNANISIWWCSNNKYRNLWIPWTRTYLWDSSFLQSMWSFIRFWACGMGETTALQVPFMRRDKQGRGIVTLIQPQSSSHPFRVKDMIYSNLGGRSLWGSEVQYGRSNQRKVQD